MIFFQDIDTENWSSNDMEDYILENWLTRTCTTGGKSSLNIKDT